MGKRRAMLLLVLVVCYAGALVGGQYYEETGGGGGKREREEEEEEEGRGEREEPFLLRESKHVFKTDAGEMRVVWGHGGKKLERRMHIGFLNMEPKSMLIPQYLDSSVIIFIRRGEARLEWIHKYDLVEKRLKAGDVYRIEAGSPFYLVNTGEGQRLRAICSIDTSESLGFGAFQFQSFFIGGGTYPTSVLSGFDHETLATAFNVSVAELREILTRQDAGPILYLDSHPPSVWTQFLQLKERERLAHLKGMVQFGEAEKEEKPRWSFRKLLFSLFVNDKKRGDDRRGKSPDSYNIFDRRPDFKNDYGWSLAVDESEYSPLKHSGIGIYLVNLTAGSMMAPHVNPTATEYGIVLRGTGRIQIVFPNGTQAMDTKVSEGEVFWIPRYFPFCQIASTTGPFEFFGFTTSSRKNRPQFLVGSSSILQTMKGPEFAAAFGVSEDRLRRIIDAQREGVILPPAPAGPPEETRREKGEEEEEEEKEDKPKVIRDFGNDMIMGFD